MTGASSVIGTWNLGVSRAEKVKIGTVYAAIGAVTAFSLLVASVIGHVSPVLNGLGLVAYVLGLRHGVDADHIAAIDNTTRKLIQQGKPRFTVGTWFSLGHSTIVFGLIASIVFVSRSFIGSIPALRGWGDIAGTLISGAFLVVIGFLNLLIVFGVYRLFKQARVGKLNEEELEESMANRGFLNRIYRPLFRFVNDAWQIYPIGVLFGLGFDTATEVALIAISVGVGVSSTVPLWQIMVLPLLFTCGMVLTDTSDGVIMRNAYAWAFLTPLKKVYYNLTVTVMSVLVAFAVGGIEAAQVLGMEYNMSGGFWNALENLDFESMGFVIVGIFVVTWGSAYAVWRYKKYDKNPSGMIGTGTIS